MSTYSIPVSGPSPRLAMLRALALKASHTARELLSTAKVVITRGGQLARTASTVALAIIGSDAGYQFARNLARAAITSTAAAVRQTLDLLGTTIRLVARGALAVARAVSPAAAARLEAGTQRWLLAPISTWSRATSRWAQRTAETVWELSDHPLVKSLTIRSAQAAGLLLALHGLTQGVVAARVVQALPWLMDAVIAVTNPTRVVLFIAAVFLSSLVVTAARLLGSPKGPEPLDRFVVGGPPVDSDAPELRAGPRVHNEGWNFNRIAAQVNVEVAPDGSVVVHGIPAELPDDVGRHVAQIAADAAAERLRKVLLHRPVPNRDDRRLLTKTAREALRAEGRRATRSAA